MLTDLSSKLLANCNRLSSLKSFLQINSTPHFLAAVIVSVTLLSSCHNKEKAKVDNSSVCKTAIDLINAPVNQKQAIDTLVNTSGDYISKDQECLINLGLLSSSIQNNALAIKHFDRAASLSVSNAQAVLLYIWHIILICESPTKTNSEKKECRNKIKPREELESMLRVSLTKDKRYVNIISRSNASWFAYIIDTYTSPLAALPFYEKALELAPEDLVLMENYGGALRDAYRFDAAVDVFENLSRISPASLQNDRVFSDYFYSLLQLSDFEKIDEVCQKYPNCRAKPMYCFYLANIQYKRGLLDEAFEEAEKCLSQIKINNFHGDYSDLHLLMANILYANKKYCDSTKYYKLVVAAQDVGGEIIEFSSLQIKRVANLCKQVE